VLGTLVEWELARAGRSKATYAFRAAVCVVPIGMLYWSAVMRYQSDEALQTMRRMVDWTAHSWQAAVALLVGPLWAAYSIADERSRGTLDQVVLAAGRLDKVYLVKFVTIFVQCEFLLLASLPLNAVSLKLGAVDFNFIVMSAAYYSLMLFFFMSAGMLCSVCSSSGSRAALWTLGLMSMWAVVASTLDYAFWSAGVPELPEAWSNYLLRWGAGWGIRLGRYPTIATAVLFCFVLLCFVAIGLGVARVGGPSNRIFARRGRRRYSHAPIIRARNLIPPLLGLDVVGQGFLLIAGVAFVSVHFFGQLAVIGLFSLGMTTAIAQAKTSGFVELARLAYRSDRMAAIAVIFGVFIRSLVFVPIIFVGNMGQWMAIVGPDRALENPFWGNWMVDTLILVLIPVCLVCLFATTRWSVLTQAVAIVAITSVSHEVTRKSPAIVEIVTGISLSMPISYYVLRLATLFAVLALTFGLYLWRFPRTTFASTE